MSKFTQPRNETNRNKEVIEFGVADEKGRTIGVEVITTEFDFVEVEGDYGYTLTSGAHKFFGNVMMTRGGKTFGASQRSSMFDTAAERDAYVARRIAASKKNALKKYGKAEVPAEKEEPKKAVATKSTGSVAKVWEICSANAQMTRKEIIAKCIEAGVNAGTAATQFAKWKKAQG